MQEMGAGQSRSSEEVGKWERGMAGANVGNRILPVIWGWTVLSHTNMKVDQD